MEEIITIQGPVELYDGQLVLRIPLACGGDKLAPYAKGIGEIEGDFLQIVIKPWLAEKLNISQNSLVIVDNCNAELTITRSAENDLV